MANIKDRLSKVLCEKPRVITKAVFWSIPHHSDRVDIRLKLGRYKKPSGLGTIKDIPEILEPKSELTLDEEEFKALISFLQNNYEPFKQGFKAFIPLDRPYEKENAEQILI